MKTIIASVLDVLKRKNRPMKTDEITRVIVDETAIVSESTVNSTCSKLYKDGYLVRHSKAVYEIDKSSPRCEPLTDYIDKLRYLLKAHGNVPIYIDPDIKIKPTADSSGKVLSLSITKYYRTV